jgi:hypothetical protein
MSRGSEVVRMTVTGKPIVVIFSLALRPYLARSRGIVRIRLDEGQSSSEAANPSCGCRSVRVVVNDDVQRVIWLIGAIQNNCHFFLCWVGLKFQELAEASLTNLLFAF